MSIVTSAIEHFPSWFMNTPAGVAAVKAREQSAHKARQALVDQLDGARRELSTTAEHHDRLIEPLQATALAAKAAYDVAEGKLRLAHRDRATAVGGLEQRIARLVRDLTASADRSIDEARWAMERRWEALRGAAAKWGEEPTELRDGNTLKPVMLRLSNTRAITRLLAAMRAARVAFDAVKLQNPENLEAAIGAIDATVPWDGLDVLEPEGPPAA